MASKQDAIIEDLRECVTRAELMLQDVRAKLDLLKLVAKPAVAAASSPSVISTASVTKRTVPKESGSRISAVGNIPPVPRFGTEYSGTGASQKRSSIAKKTTLAANPFGDALSYVSQQKYASDDSFSE